ncbi:hypothetical protein KR200_009983 [Drosophila serrata]|nr:hypothetical protein KR200_009983 [Drosophila serrata]
MQEDIVRERKKKVAQKKDDMDREKQRALEAIQAEKTKQKRQIQALSFNARGKSSPFFQFGDHDDVHMISDASVEKEESHAEKVLRRSWYERNKHIFPASRWEQYDPTKSYDKYTIKDKDKSKK